MTFRGMANFAALCSVAGVVLACGMDNVNVLHVPAGPAARSASPGVADAGILFSSDASLNNDASVRTDTTIGNPAASRDGATLDSAPARDDNGDAAPPPCDDSAMSGGACAVSAHTCLARCDPAPRGVICFCEWGQWRCEGPDTCTPGRPGGGMFPPRPIGPP